MPLDSAQLRYIFVASENCLGYHSKKEKLNCLENIIAAVGATDMAITDVAAAGTIPATASGAVIAASACSSRAT